MEKFLKLYAFISSSLVTIAPTLLFIVFWIAWSFKTSVFFFMLYSLMMFLHISLTTIANSFMGGRSDFNGKGDLFWKMYFLLGTCVGATLYFVILK